MAMACVGGYMIGMNQGKYQSNLPAKIWIWSTANGWVLMEFAWMMVIPFSSTDSVKFGSRKR